MIIYYSIRQELEVALDNILSDEAEENEIQQKLTSTAIMRYLVQLVRYTLFIIIFKIGRAHV